MPPPAQRRLPGPSSILLPPSLADVQRPSADEAEPSQRMRSGPSATPQPAEEPGRAIRKACKTLVEIDRLQQKAASCAALSLEELAKMSRTAELRQQASLLSTAEEAGACVRRETGGGERAAVWVHLNWDTAVVRQWRTAAQLRVAKPSGRIGKA
jgi:hypothetical protein